jgi:hypothetical protein
MSPTEWAGWFFSKALGKIASSFLLPTYEKGTLRAMCLPVLSFALTVKVD